MLKARVITAVLMAAVFLAAVAWLALPALALLFALVVALGAWEWSRLAGLSSPLLRLTFAALVSAAMAAIYHYCELDRSPAREQVQPLLGIACLWWSIAVLWLKSYPGSAAIWGNRPMRSLMGILVLVPTWTAAVYLLSLPRGSGLLVLLVLIVAIADIGAYFSGRLWGQHHLAPTISPAKTWEGFWGGVACCFGFAVLVWYLLPPGLRHLHFSAVVAVVLATGLASVAGDLLVSMVKRDSGVKDSGSLLPGHGGLLDRLDSLCAAAPVFALGLLLAGW